MSKTVVTKETGEVGRSGGKNGRQVGYGPVHPRGRLLTFLPSESEGHETSFGRIQSGRHRSLRHDLPPVRGDMGEEVECRDVIVDTSHGDDVGLDLVWEGAAL